MRTNIFTLPFVLCTILFSAFAAADEFSIPEQAQRQGMSYEEYSHYREQMRKRMEGMHAGMQEQAGEISASTQEKTDTQHESRAYGQGYHSRNQAADKPGIDGKNLPDRPRMERFNRDNMMRR